VVIKTDYGELFREELEEFCRERNLSPEEGTQAFTDYLCRKWGIPPSELKEWLL